MVRIEYVNANDKKAIEEVVNIHIRAFKDFFLSTMSSSFIRKMYHSYCVHEGSELMVTYEEDKAVGFLAYSTDMSGLYKYMLTRHFFFFAWYAFRAFIKRPSSFLKLFSALRKPSEAKRAHNYVKLSSIGVLPEFEFHGIGTRMMDELKSRVDFSKYLYIALETDAEDNDVANAFYQKNGFVLDRVFTTHGGRMMNEYRYCE